MKSILSPSGAVSSEFVQCCDQLGQTLYWHRYGGCSIQVRQHAQYRWLLINHTLQSIVARRAPSLLLFEHLQQLAQQWQNLPAPNSILELGLGGGAIRNYLSCAYPDAKLVTVEKNPDIIHCYKRYFGGQHDTQLKCANAQDVLREQHKYDWIIIDLFSENDAPLFLFTHQFYQAVRSALTQHGHVFINFLAHHDSQLKALSHVLITSFGKHPRMHKVEGYANILVYIQR